MKRFLARHIVCDGIDWLMVIAQFPDDLSSVELFPFKEELAATVFLEGKIEIVKSGDTYRIVRDGKPVKL